MARERRRAPTGVGVSTAAVADHIRRARERRAPVRVRGAGTWLDAGRPVRAADSLSLAGDRGIVEYVAGDLTLTARAGTPLDEIEHAARANGQWLPLAPWGSPAATLGATISTASPGPYAAAFGLPRDAVLGLEFVTGQGDVVRAGGRVVKNVAGFDLTRLLTGSWGTLGVITEATVRLRAIPAVTRTITIAIVPDTNAIHAAAAAVRDLPFAPFACELLTPAMAGVLGLGWGDALVLLVELGGNRRAVDAQLDAMASLGRAGDAPDGSLQALRAADGSAVASWRWSDLPGRFAHTWTTAQGALREHDALLHGSVARGVVRAACSSGAPEALARACASLGGSTVVERLPTAAWPLLPPPRRDALADAVRRKFDPDGILNPGIMGGTQ